jgi:Tol biopolymer transport system component
MTSERRFERDLPRLFEQLAAGPTPDYRDDIVRQTAHVRQRPAWTFPERWLPMTAVTTRLSGAPPLPWRMLALVALLLVALVVGALLIAGARSRLPAPFGPAANGQIAYAANGDIYTVDPVSRVATAVVSGNDLDRNPVWSRDGTHLAFERKVGDSSGPGRLYIARSDGGDVKVLTPVNVINLSSYTFSPDGREIAYTSGPEGDRKLWVAKADGTGVRQLDVKLSVQAPVYRPPNGAELIFADETDVAKGYGIYALDIGNGTVRQLLAPTPGVGLGWVRMSPDGSRIAYETWTEDPNGLTYVVHVMNADGTGAKPLPMPPGVVFEDAPEWSNDSRHIALIRGYKQFDADIVLAIVPADGSGFGVETRHRVTSCCSHAYEWAPDDSVILMTEYGFEDQNPLRQLLIDPATGATSPAAWDTTSTPAWQRRAP